MFSFFLFSLFIALYLHQTNALLYKLQTAHPPPHPHQTGTSQHLSPEKMLVPTSNEKARQELIYLFITPPTTKGHISMPALQILCYLRMAKIPFYALNNRFLLASSTGKPQFAQIKGQIFDDPNKIIDEIETIEAIKNKQPQRIVAKTENEIKMEEALDTMQNIIYADLLTSSENKKYDDSFPLDGSSQIEMWMEDDGLKEQMFSALIKLDAANAKGTGKTIHNNNDEFVPNEVEFMNAYFKTKYRGMEFEKDNFLITHEKLFTQLQSEFSEDGEEFGIDEVKKGKQKKIINLQPSPQGSNSNHHKMQQNQSDWDRFVALMAKRIDKGLREELAKLKSSIDGFSQLLSEKTIKIPILTDEEMKRMEEEEAQRRKQEEMKKRNENALNRFAANSGIALIQQAHQQAQTLNKRWGALSGKLSSSFKNLQMELGKSSAASQIQKFEFKLKKMAECSEDELVEAFKHSVDVLGQIVKTRPFSISYYEPFLFHKKATATETRLLATLSHLFTKPQTIPKLKEFMVMDEETILVRRPVNSYGQAYVNAHLPPEYKKRKFYRNQNLRILSDYFEMRRDQFDFNFKSFDTLKPMMSFERKEEWKYMGLYPFQTNSMEWLPKLVDALSLPQEINVNQLGQQMVGPDHEILITILEKIVAHFWGNLKDKQECKSGNYSACKKGLMHIVAAYLCGLDYKNEPKKEKEEEGAKLPKINFIKGKECSEKHFDEFNKLDLPKQLLEPLLVPMKNTIDQTIEEFVGIEKNILEAINRAKNAQEEMGKKGKGKAKVNELAEGNFMMDLF